MTTMVQDRPSTKPRPERSIGYSTTVALLCPDLLGAIMLLTAFISKERLIRQCTVLSLAQVCSSWRRIILALPHLWNSLIDFESCSEEWLEELLRRSDPSPIDINKRCYLPREASIVALEMDYLHRLRTYRALVNDESWEVLAEKICNPAPQLEALELMLTETGVPRGVAELPLNSFAGHSPMLKRLSLTRFRMDFSLSILKNITSLSISYIPSPYAPTSLQWLESLQGMPSLTQLSIKDAISPPRRKMSRGSIPDGPISLPILHQIYVDGTLNDVNTLISRLNFPTDTALTVSCSNSKLGPDFDSVRTIFTQRFNQIASSSNSHLLHSLSISADASTLSITNEPADYDPCPNRPAPDIHLPCLYLELHSSGHLGSEDQAHTSWAEMLTSFVADMDKTFSQLTSLELQLPSIPPAVTASLTEANRLETLVNLSGVMTKKLLPTLQKQSENTILLPSLRSIVFTKDDSMWGSNFRIFQSFLRWRTIANVPVEKVEFHLCSVLDDTVKALEYLGVRVDCDADGLRWERL